MTNIAEFKAIGEMGCGLKNPKGAYNSMYTKIFKQFCYFCKQRVGNMCMHLRVHTLESPYKCSHCDKEFKVSTNLFKHLNIHSTKQKEISAAIPADEKKNSTSSSFPCNLKHCVGLIYGTSGEVVTESGPHNEMYTNRKVQTFKCGTCGRCCTSQKLLRSHTLTHARKRSYICNICGRRYSTGPGFKRHIMTHTGERPFKCTSCEKGFITKPELQLHNMQHTGQRPFKCTICDKCSTTRDKLKIHMMTHTGERPFKCTSCEKGFITKRDLQLHNMQHTGQRPFKCTVCDKCSTTRHKLKMHMMTHTGERPFKCTTCENGYISKLALKRHIAKTHPLQ